MLNNISVTAAVSVIAMAAMAGSVQAQTVPGAAQEVETSQPSQARPLYGTDEILVTARRREESLQDVPVAVSAFSGELLQQRSVRNVSDLQQLTPGLAIQGAAGRRGTPSVSIRGQRTQDTLVSADPSVAFYFNEVILSPVQGANLGVYDLGNVQVLKGPQGTLFGRNTTGGAILFTPNKPGKDFAASLTARYGNYDEKALTGFINIPITPELRFRAAGNFRDNDGYGRIIAGAQPGHRLDSSNEKSFRVIGVWEPSSVFSNEFIFAYDKSRSGGAGFVLRDINPASSLRFFNGGAPFGLPSIFDALSRQRNRSIRELEANSPIGEQVDAKLVTNTTTIQLGEVQLKNIFGFRKLDYGVQYDGDDAAFSPSVFAVDNPAHSKQYSDEVQLSGTAFDNKMNWIGGFYYFYQNASDRSNSTSLNGLNPNSPQSVGGIVKNTSVSGYLQQTSEILPRLSLTTGFRYTVDRRRATMIIYTIPPAPNANLCNIFDDRGTRLQFNPALPFNGCFLNNEKTFSRPTWTISLDYKPNQDTLIYAASRRGYRTGGFNLRAATASQRRPFNPETVTDFELGFKGTFRTGDWTIRTTVAGYVQKYKGIQRNVTFLDPTTGAITSSTINAASATVKGGEADLTIIPLQALQFDFGYSYVKPKYNTFLTAAGDFSDRTFSGVPRHQFNANARFTALDDDQTGTVTLTANYSYRSGFYHNELFQTPDQIRRQGGFTSALAALIPNDVQGLRAGGVGLINGRIAWDRVLGSNFSAAVYGKNLTNKTYVSSGLSLYESLGTITNTYGDPRTYGLEVSVAF